MNIIIVPLIYIINFVLNIFFYSVLAHVVLGWLSALGIINTYHPFINKVAGILHQLVEPFLRPIRNVLPNLAGIDFSPFVLLLAVGFIQYVLTMISLRMMGT